ncbi:probable bifunctional dTTP/UTP pyrophosphatase/methyltransferase protein [Amphiura filiformis]|uniref:probable bifunctional dTTP/UTP pyrophosphatase/methyltransferase protein n=1 Tax=Amphiura filiformis TaxID=82378 RepID=UPI003B220208
MLQPILHKLSTQRIVLASGSPRRKQILANIGLKFEVVPSTFEENLDESSFDTPQDYARETALRKTMEVASRLDGPQRPDLIIGADTVVALGNQILEKPNSTRHAFEILSNLSGKTHMVHTGVVLLTRYHTQESSSDPFKIVQFYESTEVTFAELSTDVINGYIDTGEPMDKAGGYGIQALGGTFVSGIHGDYYNVMGFPLHHFCKQLVNLYS